MSENRKGKIFSKKGTGTVPKIKYGNNNHYPPNHHNLMSNNLSSHWLRQDFSGASPNCGQNITHSFNPYTMESTTLAEDQNFSLPRQNSDLHSLVLTSNAPSVNDSEPNSRRASVATIPKCQNFSKFPDKQKIQDKLDQIREYLNVTTSLMSTLKCNEDPRVVDAEKEQFQKMIKDLKDSEVKLLVLLNVYDSATENQENNVQEVNDTLLDLAFSNHIERFSQILDILANPEKIFVVYNTNKGVTDRNGSDSLSEPSTSGYQSNVSQKNELEDKVEQSNRKLQLLIEQQNALLNLRNKAENQLLDVQKTQEKLFKRQQKEKEENQIRNEKLMQERILLDQANKTKISENNFDATIKELEDTLNGLKVYHNNADMDTLQERLDNSNHLIQLLGTRDAQLNSEHMELQEKLNELQSKKQQIDHLATELQNLNEDNDDEDIGIQVRKIVTMKQQLTQLKDMLEVVKNAEEGLLEQQNSNDDDSESIDNFNYIEKNIRSNQSNRICDNSLRIDNNARSCEQWPVGKESNKDSSNIREREKMLAELKAKKRELEEIIFKQKDRTLINNDICSESSNNKSDLGDFEGPSMGYAVPPILNRQKRTPIFLSEDCSENINEYAEVRSEPNFRRRDDELGVINASLDCPPNLPPIPSHNSDCRSNATSSTAIPFNRPREQYNSVNEISSRNQIQKQLETIQGMFQSLIEQQSNSNRNTQTSSPLYAEPRRYMSPGTRESSVLNVVNPVVDPVPNSMGTNAQRYGLNTGDLPNNDNNLMIANTLQLQSFLLNTLNQCCQMLWFQQREIASLRHTVTLMLDRMVTGVPPIDQHSFLGLSDPTSTIPFFNTPVPPTSVFRVPAPSKINQSVSAACSMPNLNQAYVPAHPQSNMDQPQTHSLFENRNNNNNANARMLDTLNFNNSMPMNNQQQQSEQPLTNNNSLHNINTGANHQQQSLPGQLWNGQAALNNQVAPGNRANNYWDNFRSYSRQNLLSTSKSNEVVQNASGTSERSNRVQQERSHSQCTNYTLPKSNATQKESTESQNQNVHQLLHSNKPNSAASSPRKSSSCIIPPDVLNINHARLPPEEDDEEDTAICICSSGNSNSNHLNESNRKFNFRLNPQDLNENAKDDETLNHNFPQEQSVAGKFNFRHESKKNKQGTEREGVSTSDESSKELPPKRNRNEQCSREGEESNNNSPKSKLFEQLRDSVYKEVANLISANETRPHFLIQLFRDLQSVNSDPLRHRTLHSIQTMITNPVDYPNNASKNSTSLLSTSINPPNVEFHRSDIVNDWHPQSPASSSQASSNMELDASLCDPDAYNVNNIIKIVVPFLKRHQDDIFQEEILEMLKALLYKAMSFGEIFANSNVQESTFYKHFSTIISEALYKFQGKRVQEIRKELIRTITEVLFGEFSFIHLIQENNPENRGEVMASSCTSTINDNILMISLESVNHTQVHVEDIGTPQNQNDDLAEADQSHVEVEEEEEEEEGAVGGIIGLIGDSRNEGEIAIHDDSDPTKLEYPISTEVEADLEEHGLDEVPTRLTANSRIHSGTPNRGKKKRKR